MLKFQCTLVFTCSADWWVIVISFGSFFCVISLIISKISRKFGFAMIVFAKKNSLLCFFLSRNSVPPIYFQVNICSRYFCDFLKKGLRPKKIDLSLKKYHKNERHFCLIADHFLKLSQNMCLINTHILIYRHARCNCKLWNAIWCYCVF